MRFRNALLISLITHSLILFKNANLDKTFSNQKEKELEIRYLARAEKPVEYLKPQKPALKDKIPASLRTKVELKPSLVKPGVIRPDIISIKRKITLSSQDVVKVNSIAYLTHSQIVREKIKRALYHNYSGTDTGEVHLSFVISREGYLKEVRINKEKSGPNPYLQEIALRSLRDASPFPRFPQELDYPQLSFNVIVSFQIE